MSEIESIISAVCRALTEETGETAVKIFPAGAKKRFEAPVITVGLRGGSGVPAGFAEYLGQRYDEDTARHIETYGKRMEITLGVDIYSPNKVGFGAGKCIDIAGMIMGAVQKFDFIRIRKVSCGETGFDASAGMFRCPMEMECVCVFYADKVDDGELSAFRLRGEIKEK